MSNSNLSDEQIYSALETAIDYFWEMIPETVKLKSSRVFEEGLLQRLENKGLNERTAVAFFKASYWYLMDNKILEVDTLGGISYKLRQTLTEGKKMDHCLSLFQKYETFLLATYECSKTKPRVYDREAASLKKTSSPLFEKSTGGK